MLEQEAEKHENETKMKNSMLDSKTSELLKKENKIGDLTELIPDLKWEAKSINEQETKNFDSKQSDDKKEEERRMCQSRVASIIDNFVRLLNVHRFNKVKFR